jgi:hypothetical protein
MAFLEGAKSGRKGLVEKVGHGVCYGQMYLDPAPSPSSAS